MDIVVVTTTVLPISIHFCDVDVEKSEFSLVSQNQTWLDLRSLLKLLKSFMQRNRNFVLCSSVFIREQFESPFQNTSGVSISNQIYYLHYTFYKNIHRVYTIQEAMQSSGYWTKCLSSCSCVRRLLVNKERIRSCLSEAPRTISRTTTTKHSSARKFITCKQLQRLLKLDWPRFLLVSFVSPTHFRLLVL